MDFPLEGQTEILAVDLLLGFFYLTQLNTPKKDIK